MKNLKDIIIEKLVITKDTKEKLLVDIKEETCFTQKEIDEIRNFSESCKIKPIIITNQICDSAHGLIFEKNVIFIHFYNEWKEIPPYKKAENIRNKEEQIITIRFEKSSYTDKYYYNALSNKNNWLYSGNPSVQSCEEAIIFIKNDLKKEILESKFSQNKILEKLIITKDTKERLYNYHPKTKSELQDIIEQLLKERGDNADLNDIDTSKITDMSNLFFKEFPHNIDISKWDVSNVEDMGCMFYNCPDFNCDLSDWVVRKVTNMRYMFRGCNNFKGEGLDNWKVNNNTDIYGTFDDCKSLIKKPSWYIK